VLIEIIVIVAFVALAVGRIAWDKRSGRKSSTSQSEENDWFTAIR